MSKVLVADNAAYEHQLAENTTLLIAEVGAAYDNIIAPLVLKHYGIEHLEGLDAEAEQARERVMTFIARLQKYSERTKARSEKRAAKLAETGAA